jgi:RNA polymerase sigma-70 factor (ECF subfamily)
MSNADLAWIARQILPYETDVRRWLRKSSFARPEEDDVIQEAYCRIANNRQTDQVLDGRAYFFSVVKNLLIERLRRERLVRFEAMAELENLFIIDDEVPADRLLMDKEELSLVLKLVAAMPARCRSVLMLRRVEGLSQRETAERLEITENVVEKETAAGLKALARALATTADLHGYLPRTRRLHGKRRNGG